MLSSQGPAKKCFVLAHRHYRENQDHFHLFIGNHIKDALFPFRIQILLQTDINSRKC